MAGQGNPRTNLVLGTVSSALCFAAWSLLSPLAPQFQKDLGLSNTQTSVLIAVPVLLGSVIRIPMGILTDRFGGRKMFTALIVFTMLPVAIIGLHDAYWWLLLWGFFLGMAGTSFAIGVPFVSKWYPAQRQGFALGVYGAGNIGTAIAAYAAPAVAKAYGWPYAFWMFLIPLAAMAVIFAALARDVPRTGKPKTLGASMRIIREERLSWVFSLFYFITFGGFVAFSIYLPKLLVDWFQIGKVDAGMRAAGFVVLATASRPIGGYLSDRYGGPKVLTWVFTGLPLLAIILAFEAFSPAVVIVTIVCLVMAALLGLGNGAVFKLVAQYFPKETGTVTGVVGAAGGLGGFFPPLVMGFVRDYTGSYALGLMLLSEFALAALLINVLMFARRAPRAETRESRDDGRAQSEGRGSERQDARVAVDNSGS